MHSSADCSPTWARIRMRTSRGCLWSWQAGEETPKTNTKNTIRKATATTRKLHHMVIHLLTQAVTPSSKIMSLRRQLRNFSSPCVKLKGKTILGPHLPNGHRMETSHPFFASFVKSELKIINLEGRQIPKDCIWNKHPALTATCAPQSCGLPNMLAQSYGSKTRA